MHNNSEDSPRFFVDAMLGNIAKKIRLLGYDTKYFADIDDSNLIESAKKESRIIISKDYELVNKSEKLNIKSIFLEKSSESDQLIEIFNKTNIKKITISGDSARCPNCNLSTIPIDKEMIKTKVPQGVLEFNNKFWKCKKCNQVYWEGTHIKNLKKLIGEINERL